MKIWQWAIPGISAAALAWWITPATCGPREVRRTPERRILTMQETQNISRWQAAIRSSTDRWESMRGALELARSIPAGERMSWLQTKRFQHPDPLVAEAFLSELGRLAFEQDPAALIASEINLKSQRFREYLREMAAANPQSVIDLASNFENAEVRCACLKEAAFVLADRDPDALFKLIPEMPKADPELLQALKSAARGNSERLLTVADAAGDPWKRLLSAAVVLVKAEKDVPGALTWLGEQEHGGEVFEILQEGNDETWHGLENKKHFMEGLASVANQLPDGWLRNIHGGEFSIQGQICMLSSYAPETWLGLDLIRLGLSKQENADVKVPLLDQLGLTVPGRVAEIYQSDPTLDETTRKRIALKWVRQSIWQKKEIPAELLAVVSPATRTEMEALLERGRNPTPRPQAPSIAEQLDRAANDTKSWGLSLPTQLSGPGRGTEENFAEAEAWAKALPDERIKNVSSHVMHTGFFPPRIGDIILSRALKLGVMPDKDIDSWTSDISERAYRNPADTARSLEAYPIGRPRNQALQNIALRWHELDPQGASMWMSHLPEGDRAVATDAIARGEKWEKEQTDRIHED